MRWVIPNKIKFVKEFTNESLVYQFVWMVLLLLFYIPVYYLFIFLLIIFGMKTKVYIKETEI